MLYMKSKFIYCLFCIILSVVLIGAGCSKAGSDNKIRQREIVWAVEDKPGLPRVLLIGDSISIGYTRIVRDFLADKANVHRPLKSPTEVWNCGPTTRGLEHLEQWLGNEKWDVIHFNWGLHDLAYVAEEWPLANPEKAQPQVPIHEYEKNLEELVRRLKKTGAKLIFATTTPVPEGTNRRIKGDAKRYNEAAVKVMKRHGVIINDLYSLAYSRLERIQHPNNVHFKNSIPLAEQVASVISEALE